MSDESSNSEQSAESQATHKARMRDDWTNLIEDLIEEGRQKGVFDNLPGKGKPLKLNSTPFGRETELAHNLLKQNDLTLAWISDRNDILGRIDGLREEIQLTWARHEREYHFAQGEGHRGALRISWDDACQKWDSAIVEINKLIDSFNLKRPGNSLEIFKLTLERELARVDAPRWLE